MEYSNKIPPPNKGYWTEYDQNWLNKLFISKEFTIKVRYTRDSISYLLAIGKAFKEKHPNRNVVIEDWTWYLRYVSPKHSLGLTQQMHINEEDELPENPFVLSLSKPGQEFDHQDIDVCMKESDQISLKDSFYAFLFPERVSVVYLLHAEKLPKDLLQSLLKYFL